MKRKFFLIQLIVICLLSSCLAPKDINLLQDIPKNYPKDEMAPVDYRIIPGDQLLLNIYTVDENMKILFSPFMTDNDLLNNTTTSFTAMNNSSGNNRNNNTPINVLSVYSDGNVNIPYIGKVYVKDMTVLEAKKIIGEKLEGFSSSVSVNVTLRNRYFSVLGQAGSKVVTMNSPRMTIYQALALSGSIKTFGNRSKVRIVRQTANGTEVKVFDIRSKDVVDSEYYYIQPNDVIYIEEMNRRFFGEITSFTSIFGMVTSLTATVLLIIRLTK